MFTNLKGKLLNVSKSIGFVGSSQDKDELQNAHIDLNAGADILNHFQLKWAELHGINEQNAKEASKVGDRILQMQTKVKQDHSHIIQIVQLLTSPPELHKTIATCVTQVSQLYKSFEDVEKELIILEDVIEKAELQEKKRSHRQELNLYKQRKLANLEAIKANLVSTHSKNLLDLEIKRNRTLQERQQVFEEAFNNDLETYKSLGTIPKIETKQQPNSALLEEIQLDIDNEDLNTFLEGD